jgi:HAD superfamily hydrolase (TIGR01509 family)
MKNALPRPIEAVVFDMDGLLCDTESVIRDAMMDVARRYERELPAPVFLSMVGTSDARSRAILTEHFGADFPVDEYWRAIVADANARFADGVALKPGVVELLDHLDRAPTPRAICTSSSPNAVNRSLGPSGILPRFNAVIARGDYVNAKPHPEPYLKAALALGIAPQACLALEDSHNGVRAAHAAGMMTVMVPDLLEANDDMRHRCVHVAASLHDVIVLLGGQAG